ncbi:hypothetical protein RND64_12295 [Gordonia sp. w5E2]|uniref:DUF3077 domain-containing protein n=1 Tax=Gordonia jacobaea TaxID=122202 RepID=A0ABR5I7T4_9ACTN|nr:MULTISPECIES: hypothetical protein [Gordonia]KNA89675.1 hypothetical protein ABW18_19950 [Gordonia jacobaea]
MTTQQPRRLDTDDMRDALAYMRATVLGDTAGRMAIATNCDPAHMLDCLTAYALGLAEQAVEGGPLAWLDMLTQNVGALDRLIDAAREHRLDEDGD